MAYNSTLRAYILLCKLVFDFAVEVLDMRNEVVPTVRHYIAYINLKFITNSR